MFIKIETVCCSSQHNVNTCTHKTQNKHKTHAQHTHMHAHTHACMHTCTHTHTNTHTCACKHAHTKITPAFKTLFLFRYFQYYAESHAVIYVVDSSDRDRIEESKAAFGGLIVLWVYIVDSLCVCVWVGGWVGAHLTVSICVCVCACVCACVCGCVCVHVCVCMCVCVEPLRENQPFFLALSVSPPPPPPSHPLSLIVRWTKMLRENQPL